MLENNNIFERKYIKYKKKYIDIQRGGGFIDGMTQMAKAVKGMVVMSDEMKAKINILKEQLNGAIKKLNESRENVNIYTQNMLKVMDTKTTDDQLKTQLKTEEKLYKLFAFKIDTNASSESSYDTILEYIKKRFKMLNTVYYYYGNVHKLDLVDVSKYNYYITYFINEREQNLRKIINKLETAARRDAESAAKEAANEKATEQLAEKIAQKITGEIVPKKPAKGNDLEKAAERPRKIKKKEKLEVIEIINVINDLITYTTEEIVTNLEKIINFLDNISTSLNPIYVNYINQLIKQLNSFITEYC